MAFPAKLAQAKQLAVYFDNWVNYMETSGSFNESTMRIARVKEVA